MQPVMELSVIAVSYCAVSGCTIHQQRCTGTSSFAVSFAGGLAQQTRVSVLNTEGDVWSSCSSVTGLHLLCKSGISQTRQYWVSKLQQQQQQQDASATTML
jgi:hypothetical protein